MADFKNIKKSKLGTPPKLEQAGDNLKSPEAAPSDGRSRNATGRTEAFGTRVTSKYKKALKTIAAKDELKLVELLEASLVAYAEKKGHKLDL